MTNRQQFTRFTKGTINPADIERLLGVQPDTRGVWLPFGPKPKTSAALKQEIDDLEKAEMTEPGEVKRRLDRTLAKSDGIEARRQALAAEGHSPALAEAYIGAEVNQRAAEYLDRFPVLLEWQPQTARRLALRDMRAGR